MMPGMSFSTFTAEHVAVSLIAIFAGFIVLFGMFKVKRLNNWTALILVTTVLTSVTGFYFPRGDLLPSHIVGIISLAVLAVAILALYTYRLARCGDGYTSPALWRRAALEKNMTKLEKRGSGSGSITGISPILSRIFNMQTNRLKITFCKMV